MDQRLRKVSEKRTALGIDLFGIEADVVRAPKQPLHQHPRLIPPSRPRQRAYEPERTVQEAPLFARHAIVRTIAVDGVAFAQQPVDGVDGPAYTDVIRIAEFD